jgi:hypothetical protein
LTELEAIRRREETSLRLLSQTVERRAATIDGMITRLTVDLAAQRTEELQINEPGPSRFGTQSSRTTRSDDEEEEEGMNED